MENFSFSNKFSQNKILHFFATSSSCCVDAVARSSYPYQKVKCSNHSVHDLIIQPKTQAHDGIFCLLEWPPTATVIYYPYDTLAITQYKAQKNFPFLLMRRCLVICLRKKNHGLWSPIDSLLLHFADNHIALLLLFFR